MLKSCLLCPIIVRYPEDRRKKQSKTFRDNIVFLVCTQYDKFINITIEYKFNLPVLPSIFRGYSIHFFVIIIAMQSYSSYKKTTQEQYFAILAK